MSPISTGTRSTSAERTTSRRPSRFLQLAGSAGSRSPAPEMAASVEESDLGSMRRITADNLPILNRLSIKRVLLNPGAMRTPHWHANANELTYCVSGTALVSVLDDGSKFSSFVVTAGQMFHIDSGSLHHIENIGEDVAEFIIAFRSERPEDFGSAQHSALHRRGPRQHLRSARFRFLRNPSQHHRPQAGRTRRASRDTGRRLLQRSAQVRRRGADSAAELRHRQRTICPRSVLACAEGHFDVLAARRRRRYARTTLAPGDRRDGLRPSTATPA